MKINQLAPNPQFVQRCKEELEYLLCQPTVQQLRPCSNCTIPCTCSGSPTCTCGCSHNCEQASYQMSSDPGRYPIEDKIMPLVYEFYGLRICDPCWSCEGHCSSNGELIKIPQAWFYTRSMLYPRLISEHLEHLIIKKLLAYPWHIRITYSSVLNFDTAFSIEPQLNQLDEVQLELLQKDVAVIADNFNEAMRARARRYMETSDSNSKNHRIF
ncbi:MAG: hypothetical protein ACI906_000658 [Candidatus Latescibacterota bacterium]|jgi:hypothetical protein